MGGRHHILSFMRSHVSYTEGIPDKEGEAEFYMETTRTTQIISILVSLFLLEQREYKGINTRLSSRRGHTNTSQYGSKQQYNPRHTQSGATNTNMRDLALPPILSSSYSRMEARLGYSTYYTRMILIYKGNIDFGQQE